MSRPKNKFMYLLLLLVIMVPIYTNLSFTNPYNEFASICKTEPSINSLSSPESWWDVSYLYRAPIAIKNGQTRALSSGYSVSIAVDTSSLIASGKLRADGKDLRVVWWNSSSSEWVQLARINETNFNKNDTELWFRTIGAVPPNSVDNDYFLYYGCENAGDPPAEREKVYKHYDDFMQTDGQAKKWKVEQGNGWRVINNEYRENEGITNRITILEDSSMADVIFEFRLKNDGKDFGLGVIVGYKNKNQFYAAILGYNSSELIIGKMTGANKFSIIKSTGYPESLLVPNKWYNLKVHVADFQISVYLDDELRINVTDVNLSSGGQMGLITWNENNESYFDDVKARIDGTAPPLLLQGLEESILPPADNSNPTFGFILFIPIGIVIVACTVGVVVVTKRRNQYSMSPKRKRIPLSLILYHINNISRYEAPPVKAQHAKQLSVQQTREEMDKTAVKNQIEEIEKLGTELLSEGAYLEVVKHFEGTAATFLKYGLEAEARIFSEKAIKILKLIEEREHKLTVLEIQKLGKNLVEVTVLYNDIIEISRKLNDFDGVEMYQAELNQIVTEESKVTERKTSLTKSNNLYGEIKTYALENLEKKRVYFEKRAIFLEEQALYNATAFLYKRCKEISTQILQLGKMDERASINRYENKIQECIEKNSKKAGRITS